MSPRRHQNSRASSPSKIRHQITLPITVHHAVCASRGSEISMSKTLPLCRSALARTGVMVMFRILSIRSCWNAMPTFVWPELCSWSLLRQVSVQVLWCFIRKIRCACSVMLHQENNVFRFCDASFMVFSGTIRQLALKTADYSWSSQEWASWPCAWTTWSVDEMGSTRKSLVAIF
jgi:hypothetical protein